MQTRKEFGSLVEQYKKTGNGVEVGVQRGYFSKTISEDWTGHIFCVDIWDDEEIYKEAIKNLSAYPYFTLIKEKSVIAASLFDDESLDWVYIDADHHYWAVKQDIEAWYPKVRKGGIIAGHDYCEMVDQGEEMGVIPAVNEFVALHKYSINLTTNDYWEGKNYATWWFIK